MRILVVSKGSGSGTGASQAARYVSRQKSDEERREESGANRLFSAQADDLGHHRANQLLGDGHTPQTKDVLHLVISLAHEEDFLALGEDEPARQDAARAITRGTLEQAAEQINAKDLRWVAGIHRNTDNPHIHLLLHREYTDCISGREKRLKTLPSALRVSWEKTADGERQIKPGGLSQIFEQLLVERLESRAVQERGPQPALTSKPTARQAVTAEKELQQERVMLGRALLAQGELNRLTEQRDGLVNFGVYRRYHIADEYGQKRRLSEYDLRGQARAKANRLTVNLNLGLSINEREELRQSFWQRELTQRAEQFAQLRAARAAEQQATDAQIQRATSSAQPLLTAAKEIQQRYAAQGKSTPTPWLSPAALVYLQVRALRSEDAKRWQELEGFRAALAQERHTPTRAEDEVARLGAQLFVAQAALQTEREAAARFDETRHLRRLDIRSGDGDWHAEEKVSLAATERALRWEMDQAKFVGERRLHWDGEKRVAAQNRVQELTVQREEIQQQIAARQQEYAERIARQAELVTTLQAAHAREAERYQIGGQRVPSARFTEAELRTLAIHAERRDDPDFSRTLARLEREYDVRNYSTERQPLPERTGRALARVVMAEIAQREAAWQNETLKEKRDRTDVLVREAGGESLATARLADVAPRSRLARAFPALVTRGEAYQAVSAALTMHEQRLIHDLERATATRAVLTVVAQDYVAQFAERYPGQSLPRPAFTSEELRRLEDFTNRERDPVTQERFAAYHREASAATHERVNDMREMTIER